MRSFTHIIQHQPAYPFAVEREVIAQVEAARKLGFETEEAFALKKKQYEEEKANKRKAAARKIAPGFLDTDTRILKPEQTYALEFPTPAAAAEESEPNSTHTSPQMLQPSVSTGINDSNKVLATGTSPPDKVSIECFFFINGTFSYSPRITFSLIILNLNKVWLLLIHGIRPRMIWQL